MANKVTAEVFKQLRVYQSFTIPQILNTMLCNKLMKVNFLVERAPTMYKSATRLFGSKFVNSIIHSTYCKVFTAGTTVA